MPQRSKINSKAWKVRIFLSLALYLFVPILGLVAGSNNDVRVWSLPAALLITSGTRDICIDLQPLFLFNAHGKTHRKRTWVVLRGMRCRNGNDREVWIGPSSLYKVGLETPFHLILAVLFRPTGQRTLLTCVLIVSSLLSLGPSLMLPFSESNIVSKFLSSPRY